MLVSARHILMRYTTPEPILVEKRNRCEDAASKHIASEFENAVSRSRERSYDQTMILRWSRNPYLDDVGDVKSHTFTVTDQDMASARVNRHKTRI